MQTIPNRPNIVLILADDMGFSDIGCYGGEIATPNIDALAQSGVKMTQFYNTARCSPSRASLLTGLHPHQTGIGILTSDDRPAGYAGTLSTDCVTMAEVLRSDGYGTYMTGKWHVTGSTRSADESWPCQRGFDRFFGSINGGGSYYWPSTLSEDNSFLPFDTAQTFFYTQAIADRTGQFLRDHVAGRPEDPFFCYVAFTAPHWPLHATEEDIAAQSGRYDHGWDEVRDQRWKKQEQLNLFDQQFAAAPRDPSVPAWVETPDKEWQARRMEVYAAQVAQMDRGVGQILDTLQNLSVLDDTLVIFLSDNGGCAEEIPVGALKLPFAQETPDGRPIKIGNTPEVWPGSDETFMSYGRPWANVSNTPFREYKHWVHEGGISTPLIASWPSGGLAAGERAPAPHQLPDIMATILDITGASYPSSFNGHSIQPLEGTSMTPAWRGRHQTENRYLFWEHEGNAGCRRDKWKLVKKYPGPWELYDMDNDRAELNDLSLEHREVVNDLSNAYQDWSMRVGVIPPEVWSPLYANRKLS